MAREFPVVPFERFADDAVIHCVSERQARLVREAVARRLVEVGLELHPDKTRIVYCKDSNRRGSYEEISFTFCGYTFRPRRTANKRTGEVFTAFLPARAPEKLTAMRPPSRKMAAPSTHDPRPRQPRKGDQPRAAGLVCLLHRVLPDRGDPAL